MPVTYNYAAAADSVSRVTELLPSPQTVVLGTGVGRVAIGAAFLAAPALSTRILGLDAATAKRVTFLARMAAARDIGLGAGTLTAGPDAGTTPAIRDPQRAARNPRRDPRPGSAPNPSALPQCFPQRSPRAPPALPQRLPQCAAGVPGRAQVALTTPTAMPPSR